MLLPADSERAFGALMAVIILMRLLPLRSSGASKDQRLVRKDQRIHLHSAFPDTQYRQEHAFTT